MRLCAVNLVGGQQSSVGCLEMSGDAMAVLNDVYTLIP
jgi:hypothetical protein